MSRKNSSLRSQAAEGLWSQLTIFMMNLQREGDMFHSQHIQAWVFGGIFLKLILLQSGIKATVGQFYGEGSPNNLAIIDICQIQLLLLKRGSPAASYMMMHPRLQISTQNLYFLKPKSISGHLYQRVKPSISYSSPLVHSTADPKSQMAILFFYPMIRFEGLRSRWTTLEL